jgi:hypothetical protein
MSKTLRFIKWAFNVLGIVSVLITIAGGDMLYLVLAYSMFTQSDLIDVKEKLGCYDE